MSTESNQPSVSLRPAVADDLKQMLEIEVQCYPEPWKKTHFLDEMQRSFARLLVLTDDETDSIVAGYIVYWVQAEGISLMNMAVDPKWRGFGFGMKLMQAMIKEAVDGDIPRIVLEVRESNTSALKLYERIGFHVTLKRKKFYSNGETALVMELKTSDAPSVIQ